MTAVAGLCLAAVGTYAMRLGSVRLFGSRPVPTVPARLLRHAALGIMASLAVASLPGSASAGGVTAAGVAGVAAVVVAARRSTDITVIMAVGVAAYALVDLL